MAWDVIIDPVDNPDYWDIRVDAVNGKILDRNNFTVYCSFAEKKDDSAHSPTCVHKHDAPLVQAKNTDSVDSAAALTDGATYKVFAELIDGFLSPFESPAHLSLIHI